MTSRRETPDGETPRGQYIDVSMPRATVATMGAVPMEYELTGRTLQPRGNYPCAGDDARVSIAVRPEAEWQGLIGAMYRPPWAAAPQFASRCARLQTPCRTGRPSVGMDPAANAVGYYQTAAIPRRGRLSGAERSNPTPGAGRETRIQQAQVIR